MKQPTHKQKILFLWLVVENAFKLMSNCRSRQDMTDLINSATKKRSLLGIQWIDNMTESERIDQLNRRFRQIIPSVRDYARDRNEYSPF